MITGNTLPDRRNLASPVSNANQGRHIWHGFRKHRLGIVGLVALLLMLLAIIFGPIFFPNPYPDVNPDPSLWNAPVGTVDPSNGHLFILGSDRFGHDYLDLLLSASQLSLLVAFIPAIFALIIGFIVGALAGYYGGWFDAMVNLITDFLLSIPLLPAALILIRFVGSTPFFSHMSSRRGVPTPVTDWYSILIALVIVFVFLGWMGVARMVRALVQSLRTQNFVEAARALGASTPRILFRHLLPNTSTALLVAGTLAVGDFAVLETILAYFGLGIHDVNNAQINSLGTLLAANSDMIFFVSNFNPFQDIRGYLILFPIIFLLIIVVSINFISDALRDVFDPRSHA